MKEIIIITPRLKRQKIEHHNDMIVLKTKARNHQLLMIISKKSKKYFLSIRINNIVSLETQ
jgi:hypothetical protein